MEFTIHIDSTHREGAGFDNEYYEYDEPCDMDIEIEVDDEKVYNDIVEFIYRDYFNDELSLNGYIKCEVVNKIKERIKQFIYEFDVWDKAIMGYFNELRDKYEDEYNDD